MSHHRKTCDFIILDPIYIAAPPIRLALSEPHRNKK